MAKRNGPPRKQGKLSKAAEKPWEPTAIQMEWYRKWIEECKGPQEIAREHYAKTTRSTVCTAVHKVAEWIRLQTLDQIMNFRDRQTAQHEMIMAMALNSWRESNGAVITVTETTGGENNITTTKTEQSQGNTAYLNTAMAAAKVIREIWGVNAPIKSEVDVRHAEEITGLGMGQGHASRADAMRAAADAIKQAADQYEKSIPSQGLIEP